MSQFSHISEKYIVQNEIQYILDEISDELNLLDSKTKKKIANTVYFLGDNLSLERPSSNSRLFAFIVKKSFWFNKMSIELMSSSRTDIKRFDDYKKYDTLESLDIFDVESLIIIKHFLLSFLS